MHPTNAHGFIQHPSAATVRDVGLKASVATLSWQPFFGMGKPLRVFLSVQHESAFIIICPFFVNR